MLIKSLPNVHMLDKKGNIASMKLL